MNLKSLFLVSITSAVMPLTANANLVTNGSFEQTTLTNSGQINNANLTGWQSSAPYNVLFFPGTSDINGVGLGYGLWGPHDGSNNGLPATSPDGGNFVAADGDSDYNGPLTQMINGLVIGQSYDLSFYYGGGQYNTRSGPTTDWWSVSLGGNTQVTPTLSLASKGFSGWYKANMTFTATSTNELLSFLAGGTPNGLPPVSLLDGVSLNPTNHVPEPATLPIILMGLVGLGAILSRRKKSI